jgi:hypothetical protein
MANINFPKVCYNCRRPHIRVVEDEVKMNGGKTVRHKDCVEMEEWVREAMEELGKEKVNAGY